MAAPDTLILAGGPGERRIALLADDEVLSFVIDRGDPAVGDVFLGRVLARPAGGGATFVDIGAALPGYLPRSGDWHEGQALAVQVTAEARLDKGAVLTHRVAPESLPDMAALKPPAKLIVPGRLARLLADLPALRQLLVDDPSLLPEARKLFPIAELQRGAWRDSGAADALDLALGRVVPLAGGARLIIDEAAGATIIDVDAGGLDRDTTNRLAMREIARQVRLRNIGGQIVIDPIPGDGSGYLLGLVDQLKSHLAADPVTTDVLAVTKMRMIELVRTRRLPSLSDYFLAPPEPRRSAASLALEALQAILAEAEAAPHRRLAVVAAPAIIHYLQSRPDLIAETQTRLGRPLALEAQDGRSGFTITDKRS
ncbi:MAG TPA: ribonuclease E/G [Magnetospirillaceae bacterium]|nr:ribonuclease E/G [Magnetospirillaceae bacterium]